MTVVHVIPVAVFSNTYQGSYKDTISRVRYLETSGDCYRQVMLDEDDPHVVLSAVEGESLPSFLIEYSSFPNVVKALRRRFPTAFIAVRSHNIEPLQHFDNHGWFPEQGLPWMVYGMGRLFRDDIICKTHASAIWSISDWESKTYWNRLPGKASVKWLPYSCPEHLSPVVAPPLEQRRRIACTPTSVKSRKSVELATRFITFAERMKGVAGNRYEFVITGRVSEWGLPNSSAVTFTGMVDDMRAFLSSVRAVAVLSGKGYGFKTTITDVIANGAVAIVDAGLSRRCPRVLDPGIIPIKSLGTSDVVSTAEQLESRKACPHLDLECREMALQVLGEAFNSCNGYGARN